MSVKRLHEEVTVGHLEKKTKFEVSENKSETLECTTRKDRQHEYAYTQGANINFFGKQARRVVKGWALETMSTYV